MPSLASLASIRTAYNLWRRRRQLRSLERLAVPVFARIAAGVTKPTITIGFAKGSAAIIVEETTLLLRRRRSRTYPLHPDTANELGRALLKAARRGRR